MEAIFRIGLWLVRFLEKFERSVRVPDDVCRCENYMHKNNGFHYLLSICIHRPLHHILDPILSLFCNVKLCQRDNFGPQYLEKYEPHYYFIFLRKII